MGREAEVECRHLQARLTRYAHQQSRILHAPILTLADLSYGSAAAGMFILHGPSWVLTFEQSTAMPTDSVVDQNAIEGLKYQRHENLSGQLNI